MNLYDILFGRTIEFHLYGAHDAEQYKGICIRCGGQVPSNDLMIEGLCYVMCPVCPED